MNQDQEHLRILSIFHYVVGGISALFSCFPIFHLGAGIFVLGSALFADGPEMSEGGPLFGLFGALFTLIPAAMILLGWAFSFCLVYAGYNLSKKQHYMFCLVMAGISCAFTPFGTVLGVFTIIVLCRTSVKELFGYGTQENINIKTE